MPPSDGDCLIEVLHVNQIKTAKHLARFGKRPISDQALAVAHANAGRGGYWVQGGGGQVLPSRVELVRELDGFLHRVFMRSFAHAFPVLSIVVTEQHVFHARRLQHLVERQRAESTWRNKLFSQPRPSQTQGVPPIGRKPPLRGQPWYFHHWADFDRTLAGGRNAGGDADGLVEILDIDDIKAAELFARLGEGAVGYQPLALAHPHAG